MGASLPLLRRVFWYRVALCRSFIALYKPPLFIGNSKDGSPTGIGYLIPQKTYFVRAATVPDDYVESVDWPTLTDREAGLRGQEIAFALIEHGVVKFPSLFVAPLNDRSAQNDATDCQLRWLRNAKVEIKTERVTTANLFVQIRESGHRVHLTSVGEQRMSKFPLFEDEKEN